MLLGYHTPFSVKMNFTSFLLSPDKVFELKIKLNYTEATQYKLRPTKQSWQSLLD